MGRILNPFLRAQRKPPHPCMSHHRAPASTQTPTFTGPALRKGTLTSEGGAAHAIHAASSACKLQGRVHRLMQPEITTFPQPPPRQYSPPLEARNVCGEKRRGERNTWEGGEESCQKGRTQGELKREKRQARGGDLAWPQSGVERARELGKGT